MRKQLKDFNWHVYGVAISDYNHTFQLVKEIIRDREKQLKYEIDNIEVYDGLGNLIDPETGVANEAIADIAYYNWQDNHFLWHFCLWRLQGIFEGILKQEFLQNINLPGLKSKLDQVRKQNYVIKDSDYEELLEWGKLRNALSHHPPEQNKLPALQEKDIMEYHEFVKNVTNDLLNQKKNKNKGVTSSQNIF